MNFSVAFLCEAQCPLWLRIFLANSANKTFTTEDTEYTEERHTAAIVKS